MGPAAHQNPPCARLLGPYEHVFWHHEKEPFFDLFNGGSSEGLFLLVRAFFFMYETQPPSICYNVPVPTLLLSDSLQIPI